MPQSAEHEFTTLFFIYWSFVCARNALNMNANIPVLFRSYQSHLHRLQDLGSSLGNICSAYFFQAY